MREEEERGERGRKREGESEGGRGKGKKGGWRESDRERGEEAKEIRDGEKMKGRRK